MSEKPINEKTADAVFGQWFADQGDPARNPMKLAQTAMRPPLPKRFYKSASIGEGENGFHLLLDGKTARTPAKNVLALPNQSAAEHLAAEWNAQKDVIDPSEMHMTRMVNAGIDHVGTVIGEVQTEIAKYATSDLICYRASEPNRLVELQQKFWDPVLDWARDALDARFILSEGVMFVAQPLATLARIDSEVQKFTHPVSLSALYTMTTLGGSLVIALAVAHRHLEPSAAYAACELEADFTTEVWGADEEALFRRKRREDEYLAAAKLLLSL